MLNGASRLARLRWMLQRASAMSAAELPHRLQEAAHTLQDRRSLPRPGKHSGLVAALPWPVIPRGVTPGTSLEEATDRLVGGQLTLLGVDWPEGALDWDADPVTGGRWPADVHGHALDYRCPGMDPNLVWELHRLRHIQILALGSALLGRDDARDLALKQLDAWLSRPAFLGMAWASGIECAQRIVSLLVAHACLDLRGTSWDARLAESLVAHGTWIARYPSRHSSANNHRIAELAGLLLATSALEPCEATRSWESAARELEVLAESLWWPDGGYAEQSLSYQACATEWLLLVRAATSHKPWRPHLDPILVRSGRFLRAMMDRHGTWPPIGDDDGSVVVEDASPRADYLRSISAAVTSVLGGDDPAFSGPLPLRARLLGGQEEGTTSSPPAQGLSVFSESGLSVFRSPRVTAWFDHGPVGLAPLRAHGHADGLAVWASVDGVPFLWGLGTYQYAPDERWRTYLRSAQAHSTLAVDGLPASVPRGGFGWHHVADAKLVASEPEQCSVTGGLPAGRDGKVSLERTVSLVGDALHIDDHIRGPAVHQATWWFHLAPTVLVEEEAGVLHLSDGVTSASLILPAGLSLSLVRGGPERGPGWASPSYNLMVPTTSIRLQGQVVGEVIVRTSLVPGTRKSDT